MLEINLPLLPLYQHQNDAFSAFFRDQYDLMMMIWHRRAGKDLTCLQIAAAFMAQRVGTVLYLLDEQAHGKRIIWEGMDADGRRFLDYFPPQLVRRRHNTELLIEYKNDSIFRMGGANEIDRWIGTNPILIIWGEYSIQKPGAWELMRPILIQNKGKSIFQFTPRSYNHAYNLYMEAINDPAWYVSKLDITQTFKLDGTPIYTPERIEEEIKKGVDPAVIKQEYYCSFEGPNVGSYYGKILTELNENSRILDFNINPDVPVYTSWDLGVNHPTVIWFFQYYDGMVHVIHCYANHDEGLEHYYQYIVKFAEKYHIKYHTFIAPHDIRQRSLSKGGRTRLETAAQLGIKFEMASNTSIEDGINASRRLLHLCVFHKTLCAEGLKALREYGRKWNIERKCYMNHPADHWSNDYADAFRMFAVTWRQPSITQKGPNQISY